MAPNSKKTKVRVLVRLRPERPQYKEKGKDAFHGIPERCVRAVDSQTLELWNWRNAEESIRFRFNGFFDEISTQEDLYHSSVCPLIPFVLQGQNASVFAYGSTGAGKTHTMVGTHDQPGLIPRCVDELFKVVNGNQAMSSEWSYKVSFSYLEIYQEKIKDLLNPSKDDLPIRQDREQNIFIPNLTEMALRTCEDFMVSFEKASQKRTTAATKLNSRSSRSHSIVLLKLEKVQEVAPFTKLTGKFFLIDLAGSEDNRRTGNEGVRLKESGAINSSLFALSQVVDALNQGLPRVPYRNSKLTRLLQDSLGGTAHACVIANIAPERAFYADTSNTLNFASKSRTIINVPFVKRTQDKSVAFKRPSDSVSTQKQKRRKLDEQTTTEELAKSLSKHAPRQVVFSAENLSSLREEQQRLQDRLAALERLTQLRAETQITTNKKKVKTAECRPPLKDINRSSVSDVNSDVVRVIFRQSPECAVSSPPLPKQKSALSVDETFKVQINPLLQEAHNQEILATLNNGSTKELRKLQGVGEKRARLIAEWRTTHGPFQQVHDLKLIDGFTDKMVATFLKNNLLSRITFN